MNNLQIAIPQELLQKPTLDLNSAQGPNLGRSSFQSTASGTLELIAGDASDRKFYRFHSPHNNVTSICMVFPKWEGGYGGDPMSWLGMHAALNAIHIPLPHVIAVQPKTQCIWTEDLGDHFLHLELSGRVLDQTLDYAQETIRHYEQALDLLVQAQYPLHAPLPENPATHLCFDETKLLFELKFFEQHFLKNFLGLDTQKTDLHTDFVTLAKWLHLRPRVLCHRDYHARNIMIFKNSCHWIDFQDARMGPQTYDVVSLLRDSYVKIEASTRARLFRAYLLKRNQHTQELGLGTWDEQDYGEECLFMGLQRNIKALGSFGYLATAKSKPHYLKFVSHTLSLLLMKEHVTFHSLNLESQFPRLFELLSNLSNGSLQKSLLNKIAEHIHD